MTKKILIVSIIAVAILIGVSLTSVVGYQSVKSNYGESPLFNVRSARAIERKNDNLTYNYIGRGEDINLKIPKRDKERIIIEKSIKIIKNLDEKQIEKLLFYIIKNKQSDDNLKFNFQDIRSGIREQENINISKSNVLTFNCDPPTQWNILECVLFYILLIMVLIGDFIWGLIQAVFYSGLIATYFILGFLLEMQLRIDDLRPTFFTWC